MPFDPESLRPLDARVRTLWWCTSALLAVPVALVALAVGLRTALPPTTRLLTAVTAIVALLASAVVPVVRFRRWRYALRDEDLQIRRGVLWTTVSVIPYARLQFVDTTQGPLDRLFGLAQLVVHTAAPGTSGRLPGLDAQVAERLRERLAQLARPDGDDALPV